MAGKPGNLILNAWRAGVRLARSRLGLYVFFGVCTTALNFVLFLLCFHVFGWSGWLSNTVAWWPSVVFAWWTNRLWVFDARRGASVWFLLKELTAFTGSRLFTGVTDVALIWLTVDLAKWNEVAMKIVVGVIIVVLNYVVSRWFVFRSKKEVA